MTYEMERLERRKKAAHEFAKSHPWDEITEDGLYFLWGELVLTDSRIAALYGIDAYQVTKMRNRFNIKQYNIGTRTTQYGSRFMVQEGMYAIPEEKRDFLRKFAEFLAVNGVRNNTDLEDLHAGTWPSSKTGDYSDVKVVTPYGEIPWNELSRIDDCEMRSLMLSVEQATEAALLAFEALSDSGKDVVLNDLELRRTYDLPEAVYTGVGVDEYRECNADKPSCFFSFVSLFVGAVDFVKKSAKWVSRKCKSDAA